MLRNMSSNLTIYLIYNIINSLVIDFTNLNKTGIIFEIKLLECTNCFSINKTVLF